MRRLHEKGSVAIIVIVILLIAVTGLLAYIFGQNSSKFLVNIKSTPSPVSTGDLTSVESPKPTTFATPHPVPKENAVYYASYNGKDVLFFTNKDQQRYFESGGVEKRDTMVGSLAYLNGGGAHPFKYSDLQNPKRINIDYGLPIQMIYDFEVNKSTSMFYISLILEDVGTYPDNALNKVYQVKLSPYMDGKEVWSNKIGSNKYPGKGAVSVDSIGEDKFLSLTLFECYACGGHNPSKTIVVNIATKKENYMEMIGNVQFDIAGGTFSYQKLSPVYEDCEPGPGCDNGKMQFLKPSGAIYNEKLP